ncbi:MAG: tetratricopeptide repeat protein [bacterium]|nr:tetratricopeptide repeat protein [bacterium]
MRLHTTSQTFGLILLLALLAVASGCSDPAATKLRYDAEKLFHQAEKQLSDAEIRQQLRDDKVARQIRDAYGASLTTAYAALDQLDQHRDSIEYMQLGQIALRSASRLSQFYYKLRRYDTCTVILNELLGKLTLPSLETAVTWVNLGQALQASGQWDSAITVYGKAIERVSPPIDMQGEIITPVFSLPAQIYQIYSRIGDTVNARQQYVAATDYYGRFARQRTGTKLGTGSWTMLGILYGQEKQWPEAINAYEQLKDSAGQTDWRASTRIGDIYAIQLGQLDRAVQIYDDILARLRGSDTLARPQFIFKKALVYMEKKQYDQARSLLADLNRDYRGFFMSNPAPQFVKAQSYEKEGNWERAETEYRFLIDNYAASDQAMSSYLHVGDEMAKQGRKTEAEKWMGRADQFFSSIAGRTSGSQIEAVAMTYRAELLRRNSDWNGAAGMLLQVFDKFPEETMGQNALITAAEIHREKLNDPAKADSLIESLRRIMTMPRDELTQK